MDTNITGKFISQKRNEMNMTQKELAERLGVSDKAVSKWETGRGMPDISSLESLCEVLDVNLNELISGEMISPEVYEQKAEENMKNLMSENANNSKWIKVKIIIGEVIILAALIMMGVSSEGVTFFSNTIDVPTLCYIVIANIGIVLIARQKNKFQLIDVIRKGSLSAGALGTVMSSVAMCKSREYAPELGGLLANLSVALLPLCYGLVIHTLLIPFVRKNLD